MCPSKATLRFLPALVLVLLAALPAYVGSLWTGVASLALASDAPAAKPDGTTAAPTAGQNATAGTTTTTPAAQRPSAADAPTAQATADGAAALILMKKSEAEKRLSEVQDNLGLHNLYIAN